ncbi:ribosomal protein S18 acetylase RimI-like enzyme [Pedobacter sp. CG_S7]|uniref:GNAT family N-acetyltransferase n=1 Tax=Pedobacter sp. CG_S7 TaxID=3143930 RepID=UPI0033942D46
MAIQYVNLKAIKPVHSFIKDLYESTFPIQERREWTSLLSLLNHPAMQLDLICEEELPIGFIIWWKINDWLFIEHFAISPHIRGGGYGSTVMCYYMEKANGKIFLEVEPPFTIDAERRIAFYEKLGLSLLDVSYQQPSYVEKDVYYPMLLMGTTGKKDFTALVAALKEQVYCC